LLNCFSLFVCLFFSSHQNVNFRTILNKKVFLFVLIPPLWSLTTPSQLLCSRPNFWWFGYDLAHYRLWLIYIVMYLMFENSNYWFDVRCLPPHHARVVWVAPKIARKMLLMECELLYESHHSHVNHSGRNKKLLLFFLI